MTAYFNKVGWPDNAPKKTEEERKKFIASLHKQKTKLYMALIEKLLPLRHGVANVTGFDVVEKNIKIAQLHVAEEARIAKEVEAYEKWFHIAKEVEAYEKRFHKELEKQDVLRRRLMARNTIELKNEGGD